MADYRLSGPAEDQIVDILEWSEDEFGELTRKRYALLLTVAMADIAEQPRRPATQWLNCLGHRIGVYHIEHSRTRIADPRERIRTPRHLVVFRVAPDGLVDVLGFIHDSQLRRRALRHIVRENQFAL